MSVLIKGMEMPKNCCDCSLTYYEPGEGSSCIFTEMPCLNIGRQAACPLVPLPEKHGRLIDAEALWENMTVKQSEAFQKGLAGTIELFEMLEAATPVVPTEGGGE